MWRRFFLIIVLTIISILFLLFNVHSCALEEDVWCLDGETSAMEVLWSEQTPTTIHLSLPPGTQPIRSTRSRTDTDNDGLLNDHEIVFGTDQNDPDSDDDGILDGDEKLNISKNPLHSDNDPDNDGWNNALDPDSDDDGILDGTERGLTEVDINISATDQSMGHFLSDQDPTTTTDPTNWDTDGDTLSDGDEDKNANGKFEGSHDETDPNFKDFDNDKLHDDTKDEDDDNDGMPDWWELAHSFNPKNASDAMHDVDRDGFSNLNEYLKGTNPHDSNSYPEFSLKPRDDNSDWGAFLVFLILLTFIVMVASIIVGIFIIRARTHDEEFWLHTFGDNREIFGDMGGRTRDKYIAWQRRIEAETRGKRGLKYKYKLEIIGGPEDDYRNLYESTLGRSRESAHMIKYKLDPRFKGKYCLWCDRGITEKYIKRCPGLRTASRRCPDGPFCSKRCLDEHLKIVPHFHKTNF